MGCGASSAAAEPSAAEPDEPQANTASRSTGKGKYQIVRNCKLGEGTTGDVLLGQWRRGSTRQCTPRTTQQLSRRSSHVVVQDLCAIKVFDSGSLKDFKTEVMLLQQMAGTDQYCPKLLDHTVVEVEAPLPEALHIVMERAVISLDEKIEAATSFAADLIGNVVGWAGRPILPSTRFRKSWLVKNTGNTAWTDMEVVHIQGSTLGGLPAAVPAAAPGETVEVSVDMTAPKDEGDYQGAWNLVHKTNDPSGKAFGDAFFVSITVCVCDCPCGFTGSWQEVHVHEKGCGQAVFECECGFTATFHDCNKHEERCKQAIDAAEAEAEERRMPEVAAIDERTVLLRQRVVHERQACLVNTPMPIDDLRTIMSRVLDALGRVHQLGFVYRDMKPGNVMCFSDGRWALIDYGSVAPVGTFMNAPNLTYTELYMPPELATTAASWWAEEDEEKADLIGIEAASSMDMFSLGLCFLEMADPTVCVLRDSYHQFEEEEDFHSWMAKCGPLEEVLKRRMGALLDTHARSLAARMLERNPASRATIQECKDHPWFGKSNT